jgi:hypothetical protein
VARGGGGSARVAPSRAAGKRGGLGVGFYVVAAVAVLAMVAVFAIGPVRRSMALSTLDGFKSDAANPAAITAADAFLELTTGTPSKCTWRRNSNSSPRWCRSLIDH